MKKIIASLAIAAMAFAIAPAEAATNLSVVSDTYVDAAANATLGIDFTTSNVVAPGGTTVVDISALDATYAGAVTVDAGGDFTADSSAANGTITLTSVAGQAIGTEVELTVAGVQLPTLADPAVSADYNVIADGSTITMTVVSATSFNDDGSAVVTAVVLPGVTIAVTNTDTAFGALDAASIETIDNGTTILSTANTPSDLVVTVTGSVAGMVGVNDPANTIASGDATVAGTEGFSITTQDNGSVGGVFTPVANAAVLTTPVTIGTVVDAGTAVKSLGAFVDYNATIAAGTNADNYTNVLTYTASTTF